MAGMSLRRLAAHRGVTLSSVQHAILSGRVTPDSDGTLDPARATRTGRTAMNRG